jgi:tetratricopeptide (TPR) repeat protein
MRKPFLRLTVCVASLIVPTMSSPAAQRQSSSAQNPQAVSQSGPPGVTAAQPATVGPTPEQRLAVLEERMNTTLALKQEETQDLRDRIEFIYKLVSLIGGLAAFVILFLAIRDSIQRSREGERQRGIDEIVRETLRLQNAAMSQQNRLSAIQVDAAQADPARHLERIQNVNQVIDTVQKTLAFRLETEQKVADVIRTFEKQEVERERKSKQKLDSALGIFEGFKNMNRMQFATLTAEQQKRAIKLVEKVNALEDAFKDKDFEIAGHLLYTCGAITYYDEDIIQAKTLLDQAAQCRATDHSAELTTNKVYRKRFAFIHYFRSIIQKNWGELSEALFEIEQSDKLLRDDNTEFLTPVTKAEILSYVEGNEQRCRSEVLALLDRITQLEKAKRERNEVLNANQVRLRNRLLILLGNTYFLAKNYQSALEQYQKAVEFKADEYYALASAAQCHRALGSGRDREVFHQCLAAIEDSEDFTRKRERITRAVIAILAANAASGYGDAQRYSKWARQARELLEGDLSVDGLSPRFFSPATKRLVSSAELLREVDQLAVEGAPKAA